MKKTLILLFGTAVSMAATLLTRVEPIPSAQKDVSRQVCEAMAYQQGQRDLGVCIQDLRDAPNDEAAD